MSQITETISRPQRSVSNSQADAKKCPSPAGTTLGTLAQAWLRGTEGLLNSDFLCFLRAVLYLFQLSGQCQDSSSEVLLFFQPTDSSQFSLSFFSLRALFLLCGSFEPKAHRMRILSSQTVQLSSTLLPAAPLEAAHMASASLSLSFMGAAPSAPAPEPFPAPTAVPSTPPGRAAQRGNSNPSVHSRAGIHKPQRGRRDSSVSTES